MEYAKLLHSLHEKHGPNIPLDIVRDKLPPIISNEELFDSRYPYAALGISSIVTFSSHRSECVPLVAGVAGSCHEPVSD